MFHIDSMNGYDSFARLSYVQKDGNASQRHFWQMNLEKTHMFMYIVIPDVKCWFYNFRCYGSIICVLMFLGFFGFLAFPLFSKC